MKRDWPECSKGCLTRTITSVPSDYNGKKMGFPVLVRSEDLFSYPFSGLTVHSRKIKEKPDEVKRVIRAGIKANRYMRANRDGTIAVLMTNARIDKEAAGAAYDSFIKGFNTDGSMPEDGFRRLLETQSVMKMDREAALREISYPSIRKAAGVGSQVDPDSAHSFRTSFGFESRSTNTKRHSQRA